MKLLTIQEVEKNLSDLINEVVIDHQPILISNQGKDAILVSKEEWEALQETIYLNSIPGMVESIKEAASQPKEDYINLEDLEW